MGYSYEGYYVDPVALLEFAAKTAPSRPAITSGKLRTF